MVLTTRRSGAADCAEREASPRPPPSIPVRAAAVIFVTCLGALSEVPVNAAFPFCLCAVFASLFPSLGAAGTHPRLQVKVMMVMN